MQHIHDVSAANRLRIVNASLRESEILPKLFGTLLRDELHILLGSKLQATSRTCLDASRLESAADTVRAQRALVNLLRSRIELGNIVDIPTRSTRSRYSFPAGN